MFGSNYDLFTLFTFPIFSLIFLYSFLAQFTTTTKRLVFITCSMLNWLHSTRSMNLASFSNHIIMITLGVPKNKCVGFTHLRLSQVCKTHKSFGICPKWMIHET